VHSFIQRHTYDVTAVLSGFVRVILRGYLPLCRTDYLHDWLNYRKLLLKDFKTFAPMQAERLKNHAQQMAKRTGRPFEHLTRRERKEEMARAIAQRDGLKRGLIVVFSTLETCRTVRVVYGEGRPRLKPAYRRCLVLYYYFLDEQFGLVHFKLETWLPFTMQVYVNGREWLARKLDRERITYRRVDNALIELSDAAAAQRAAQRFWRQRWVRRLNAWARLVNPLLNDLLKEQEYYWVVDQAEFATDVIFRNREALARLYPRLLEHATLSFSAEDVLTFLGRKLAPTFAGEVLNEFKKRWPGARVKHRMKSNWMKMYDKHGIVLRVETVINDPTEFRVRRWGRRKGREVLGWYPMRKGIANLWRYAEVGQRANERYLDALSVVDDMGPSMKVLDQISSKVSHRGRRRRALAPLGRPDQALFAAVLRGEHTLNGFSNRDLAAQLIGERPKDPVLRRRQSARVTRQLQLLRAHGLIAKIPRSRRYRVTARGQSLMTAAIAIRLKHFPQRLNHAA